MFRRFLFLVFALMMPLIATAQEAPAPKWLQKGQKSVMSVISYDKDKVMIHEGVGYVISPDGILIGDYGIFMDAYSAVAVDNSGKKYNVERILGADNSYGLIKFVIDNKKTTPLKIASSTSTNRGAEIYAIGQVKGNVNVVPAAKVEKKDVIDSKYAYYSLDSEFDGKQEGKGAFNAAGELVGIIQSSVGGKSAVVDAAMGRDLSMAAIQSKVDALAINKVHLKKAIPDSDQEALVYIFLRSTSTDNDEYMDMVNQFIEKFPDNAEGYYRRATPLLDLQRFDEADKDLETYLKLSSDKSQAHVNIARTIVSKLKYQPEPKYDKWSYDLALEHVDKAIEDTEAQIAQKTGDDKEQLEVTNVEYKLEKARIFTAKEDYRGAISIYDMLNAGKYKAPATFMASSMAHEAAGDSLAIQIELMDSAIAQFGTPLPQEAAQYVMRRAHLFENHNQYRKAVADYNTFCYLNNNKVSDSFYYDRSILETNAKMFQQALDDINIAVDMAPSNPLYYVEKSAIHLRVGQIDECIEAARKCISLNAEYPDAYRILGYALLQKGDKAGAISNLEKAKDLGDESAQEIMDKYLN